MAHDFLTIDAFTTEAFGGNPAAVYVLDGPADAEWMQLVAREMNLSETAFLHPEGDDGEWRLRWFTPTVEVDLCGHATLASAHALLNEIGASSSEPLRFQSRSGLLTAEPTPEGAITLDFPVDNLDHRDAPDGLGEALGVEVGAAAVARGRDDWLVETTEEEVRGCTPDFGGIAAAGSRAVILTARNSREGFDIVSRVFAPGAGIDEDPVTGSAHTTLAAWWCPKLGINNLRAEQASVRGGVLEVELVGERVRLTGHAVTVAKGQLL